MDRIRRELGSPLARTVLTFCAVIAILGATTPIAITACCLAAAAWKA